MVYKSELKFEEDLVSLLGECGWDTKNVLQYPTEEELIQNWADILYKNNRDVDKLGDYPLTKTEMDLILDQIAKLRTPYKLNTFINGKTVSIKRDNPDDVMHLGKEVSLHIYDRMEIASGRSCYQIAEQPKFKTASTLLPDRRGDIMLLINGMPVFHIELKRSGVPISQAWNQIEKYSKEGVFSGIFSLIQVFVAMSPEDAVYFTNPGPDGKFNPNFYFHWGDIDNTPVKNWSDFTRDVLSIPMAHRMIGFFTVADGRDGILKVLRSYQYYAVSAITNVVIKHKDRWNERDQRGGYIWHTTGSGKTLTSFKAAELISKSQYVDKVVFLVDRIELDVQSFENYKYFAGEEDIVQNTENTGVLITRLKSSAPSDSLIVTSIQKMDRVREDGGMKIKKDLEEINRKRIAFIVDECHRDTFGTMMHSIKETFPYAIFFGFSGTPIQEENSKKGCTSSDVFGNELHRYTIGDGIRDRNVLAFDPYMVETYKGNEIKEAIVCKKMNISSLEDIKGDSGRLEDYYRRLDALQMAGCYDESGNYVKGAEDELPNSQYELERHIDSVVENVKSNFERVSHSNKFHALFATSSIREAINYYREFKKKAPEILASVLVDPSDDNSSESIDKIDGIVEVIEDYNNRYNCKFTLATYKDMKKDISLRLSHDKAYKCIEKEPSKRLDMLIVVDQMLTGFDSKWVNVLYMDKVMKQENIIQAFSRTNRVFGPDKPVGLIYYYRKPHTMKRNIDEAVKLYSGDKEYMVFVDKLNKNLAKLNGIYSEIDELFKREGIENFSHLPENNAVRAKFAQLFNQLNQTLEMVMVQGFSWQVSVYDGVEAFLTENTYHILLQRYKELFSYGGGTDYEEEPFDLDPHITEIQTGRIDDAYINSRFDKYLKLSRSAEDQENAAIALQDLYKSFALLPEELQVYADLFINDVLAGTLVPEEGKTFRDYVTEYMHRGKDTQIHRFAETFGIDEDKLREMVNLHLNESNINEFSRFDKLRETADAQLQYEYFKTHSSEKMSRIKAKSLFDKMLRRFIIQGGFKI
ncbi:MAG: HsdR family type I site-specific deoxyribonuclease [Clostridia bacterium]|nr:HsdR family type I site-specific deoxyribonuclease [Clostridia bacterium]